MKHLIVLLFLFPLLASAQKYDSTAVYDELAYLNNQVATLKQEIKDLKTTSANKEAGDALKAAASQHFVSLGLAILSGVFGAVGASSDDGSTMLFLAGGLGVISAGLSISSWVQVNRAGKIMSGE